MRRQVKTEDEARNAKRGKEEKGREKKWKGSETESKERETKGVHCLR